MTPELITAYTSIAVALIAAISSIVSAIVGRGSRKDLKSIKNDTEQARIRSEILQLIMEDKLTVMEGKLPTNYKDIMELIDVYDSHKWNTYIHRKVKEYEEWYEELTKKGDKYNVNN